MTNATSRLEPALRYLAKNPGARVIEVAIKHKVQKADLWAWLGQFNQSRPELAEHVIDGVKAGLSGKPPATPRGSAGLVRRVANQMKAGGSQPARILGPAGVPGRLDVWLHQQGLQSEPQLSFEVAVSPAVAAQWLTLNTGNRKPSRAKVRRFAEVIREGKWLLNGETIKFSASGRLVDGQSRLQAIVEAGKPATLEVRGGLPDEAQQTMDCGETRKGTHTLEMMGEANPKVLSPALRLIFKWENGSLGTGGSADVRGRMSVLENLAIKPMLARHPALRASTGWAVARSAQIRKLMPMSEAAFFHYLLGTATRLKRDAFVEQLFTGNALSQPVALLRQRILTAQDGRLSAGARLKLTVKAWNAFHAGKQLKELTLTPRESMAAIAGVKETK